MSKRTVKAADLFCGAGGTSTGLQNACDDLKVNLKLIAINHWNIAIDTHSVNHAEAEHLCTGLDAVDPRVVVPGGKLDLLIASPECTHHSIARGGRPINDQSRASAWLVLRWLETLHVQNVLIENVKEFQSWGGIGSNGRPLKRKKGETFLAFVNAIKSLGYTVDYRVLNAADYGDPTSRERLFIIARRGRRSIVWPEPTHAPQSVLKSRGQQGLIRTHKNLKAHVPAREIIDWDIEGESIFSRKRPLSPNTLARIFAGLKKYCGLAFIVPNFGEREGQEPRTHDLEKPLPAVTSHGAGGLVEPFIVEFRQNPHHRSVDQPLSTIATSGSHHGLCQPFIVKFNNYQDAESVDSPLSCVMTKDHHALCQPFVLGQQSQARPRDVNQPLPTIACDGAISLIEPFIMNITHSARPGGYTQSINEPVATVLTKQEHAIVQPFIVPQQGDDRTRSIDRPLQTILTGSRSIGLCQPFILPNEGFYRGNAPRSIDEPIPTVTQRGAGAVVQPYLVKFFGTATGQGVDEPLGTVTTKDRYGLCVPELNAVLDIRFRMLQPHELAAAMSFPKTYHFTGNREQRVKQIGNAVPVRTAQALCSALLQ